MDSSKIHGLCYNCNTDLFGTVIEVSGKYYHNKCFYCCKCRQQLRQEEFRVRDERFFCISCYSKTFERICAECNQYITDDQFIEALGQVYHMGHFVCFLCKNDFPEKKFIRKEIYYQGEQKTRPFCIPCHQQVKSMVCKDCSHPMGEVKAYDGTDFYHDFCYMRNHPDEEYDQEQIAQARERELEARREQEEKARREREEQEEELAARRAAEEQKAAEAAEEAAKKTAEQEAARRAAEELMEVVRRQREEEEAAKKATEEERERRGAEEKARLEEESRRRDEERKAEKERKEEERKRKEEEEATRKEEERKRKEEEETARKEEEERKRKEEEEERRNREKREMADIYRTQARHVDFHSSDDEAEEDLPTEKPVRQIPAVPQSPPQRPVIQRKGITVMLAESYMPVKKTDNPAVVEEKEENLPDVEEKQEKEEENLPEIDNSVNYGVDEEYLAEQKRVQALPKDQLAVYPFSVLTQKQPPKDVDCQRREYHLSEEEFEKVFKMSREKYEALANWKRVQLKKQLGLF